jgi:hypothetical protein
MLKAVENLAGVALAVLAAGAVEAAPFRVVSDGPESVWVLDAGSGELVWCRLRAPSGPKVVDVFGAEAQAREATPRRSEPDCSVAQAGADEDPRVVRARAMLGYGTDAEYGYFGDYDAERSYGGYAIPFDGSDGAINIVRPRYVDIYVR